MRKLRAPFCPHLAIGAVDDNGYTYLAPHAFGTGASASHLRVEKSRQLVSLRRQRRLYPAPRQLAGRTVIVVDDGMTTGLTMITALLAARAQGPARAAAI